jgi:hypothetical protein
VERLYVELGGAAFGFEEFLAELDKQVAGREEYDHRMVVA